MDFSSFPERLLPWYEENRRDLPWRQDRTGYHVWLSEIMLQQTRVEAVRAYYIRFLQALPTIEDLADCEDDRLKKLWEGLGYYSRVRNLKKAAQEIVEQYGGVFPGEYERIRDLPGIGDYTAGAIGSICFELPTPAVDGNVLRVAARFFADDTPIDLPRHKEQIRKALAVVYPLGRCGDFTQALMELGATVCLPGGAPKCEGCPLQDGCLAHLHGVERSLPVKTPKKPKRHEERTVFLLRQEGRYALRKRKDTGLLAGLWELPNVDGKLEETAALEAVEAIGLKPVQIHRRLEREHIFTHIVWEMRCYFLDCQGQGENLTWLTRSEIEENAALPTAFRMFWAEADDF